MGYDPEWEAQKANAVALVRQGHSFKAAESQTSVPASTIHFALAKLNSGAATAADLFRADQQLMALTYQIAATAQQEQLRRLAEPGMENRDLSTMSGLAMRAISHYRRWNAPTTDTGEPGSSSKLLDRLEAILASGNTLSLTVSPRPPDTDAIDVEARELEEHE